MATPETSREARSDVVRNRRLLVAAATAAVHKHGPRVPMAVIAADAGLGVGTLYRHFPTREDLLAHLIHLSFEQILTYAKAAQRDGINAADALRLLVEAAISQRNALLLPLLDGPQPSWERTVAVRRQVHEIIEQTIERGRTDGTVTRDVTAHDIVVFGSMLAQPRSADPAWDATCRRLLGTYLAGLGTGYRIPSP